MGEQIIFYKDNKLMFDGFFESFNIGEKNTQFSPMPSLQNFRPEKELKILVDEKRFNIEKIYNLFESQLFNSQSQHTYKFDIEIIDKNNIINVYGGYIMSVDIPHKQKFLTFTNKLSEIIIKFDYYTILEIPISVKRKGKLKKIFNDEL